MARVFQFTACAAAVAVALYAAAGHFGVPWAAKTAVERVVSEKLGRQATIESVTFNPWTWTFELKGLAIPEPGADPLLALDLLRVDLSGKTLLKLAPVVEEVTVRGLRVNAVVNEENRTLERLAGGSSEEKAADPKASTSSGSSASSGGLPAFAVYNISVSESSLRYQDAAKGIDQSITDLTLRLPFISTMESSAESLVTPALSMKLNGAPIEASGSTKPFGTSLEAKLALRVRSLDVAGIARIVPALNSDKLRIDSAKLSTDLAFTFRNPTGGKPAKMLLSGSTTLADLAVSGGGKRLATLPKASLDLGEVDLVGRSALVESLALTGLTVNAVNSSAGINLLNAAGVASAPAAADSTAKAPANESSGDPAWSWRIASASLQNAALHWSDTTVRPAAKIDVTALNASVKNLSSEKGKAGSFSVSADALGGRLEASGSAAVAPLAVSASAKGSRLTLNALAPYVQKALGADLRTGIAFDVKATVEGDAVAASGTASVNDLSLREGRATLVTVKTATVKLNELSTAKRSVDVALVSAQSPVINAVLTKKGLNLASIGQAPAASGAKTTAKAADKSAEKTGEKAGAAEKAAAADAWSWKLGEARIEGGILRFRDETIKPSASTEISRIAATAKGLSSAKGTLGTASLSLALGGGTASVSGKLGLSPLSANMEVVSRQVGLKPFSDFMTGYAGIGAKSGSFDATGRLTMSPAAKKKADAVASVIGWKGDASLSDFAMTNARGGALMNWRKASLTGMDVETTDPLRLVIAQAEIDQPAEKQTKVVKEIAGIASLISSLRGNDKTSQKIDKYANRIPTKLTLKDIRYENGQFSAAGVSAASVEGALLKTLTNAMSAKLGGSSSGAGK